MALSKPLQDFPLHKNRIHYPATVNQALVCLSYVLPPYLAASQVNHKLHLFWISGSESKALIARNQICELLAPTMVLGTSY
jgi:hypothetical protein